MSLKIPIETSARHIHVRYRTSLCTRAQSARTVPVHGTIELPKGVIVAKRHIHMTPLEASRAHVKDHDEVFVITESYERGLIFADVVVRVSPTFKLAMHVDTDEANAFASDVAPTGAILKLFDGQTYSLQQWADELQSGINR